jgi:hypothetical protein
MSRLAFLLAFFSTMAWADSRTVPADIFQVNVVGNHVTIDAPGTSGSYALHLSAAQGGSNTCLLNDGSGNLTWLAAGSANSATTLVERDSSGNFVANEATFLTALVLDGSGSGSTTLQASATASGTLTFPAITDNVLTQQSTNQGANRIKNKDLSTTSVDFVDTTDTTKVQNVDLSTATAGTTTTLKFAQSASRTLTFPDATDTVTTDAAAQTLTNKTISGSSNTLTVLAATQLSGNVPVGNGGTGAASFTADGVMLGNGGSTLGVTGAPSQYNALVGNVSGVPVFGQVNLAQSAAVTGILAPANGGTGANGVPTNGQIPIGNGSVYVPATITGTSNEVNVTNGSGTITLATPQAIGTGSTPVFGGLSLGGSLLASTAFTPNIGSSSKPFNDVYAGELLVDDGSATGLTVALNRTSGGSAYSLFWPNAQGGSGTFLKNDGSGNLAFNA